MTLRDQIALEILKLFVAKGLEQGVENSNGKHMAEAAYALADIMLKASLK